MSAQAAGASSSATHDAEEEALRLRLEEVRSLKRKARKERAERLLAARGACAAEARRHAIDSSRASAASAATALADRDQLLRGFTRDRLAREQALAKAGAEQSASRAKAEQAQRRAAAEDERQRERLDEVRRQQLFEEIMAQQAHQQEGRRQRASEPGGGSFAARQAEEEKRFRFETREEKRFRQFEEEAARRRQEPALGRTASCPGFGRPAERPPPRSTARAHNRGTSRRREAAAPLPHPPPAETGMPCDELVALPTDVLVLHCVRHVGCPHRCLGVAPNALAPAVRKRFLALARRVHPDKASHPSAGEAFAAVEEAFHSMQQIVR